MRNLFGTLVPVLLAATQSPFVVERTTRTGDDRDLGAAFAKSYADLERPGAIFQQLSPTLRVSYVSPPRYTDNKNSSCGTTRTSTWSNASLQADLPSSLAPDETKPIALYLPGLDGYGISCFRDQFDDLADAFQFWRLTVLPDDRSSFAAVVKAVADVCQSFDRPVTLIGESCGGLLAAAVAIQLSKKDTTSSTSKSRPTVLQGLVLVNPATSFDQTAWDTLVPILTSLPHNDDDNNTTTTAGKGSLTPYSVLGSLLLASIIPDSGQTRRLVDAIRKDQDLTQVTKVYAQMTNGFRLTGRRLPPQVLEHRVNKWLIAGAGAVNARLQEISFSSSLPVLVVVGEQDALLPSKREASRLSNVLNAETLRVKERGHFVLDDTVNLTEAILYSNIDPLNDKETKKNASYDPITDWTLPSDIEAYVAASVEPLRRAFSPVYFSTDAQGKRWSGMAKIPQTNGPLVVVGNHQFAAADLGILLADVREQRGIYARGLAHPVALSAAGAGSQQNLNVELGWRVPGLTENANSKKPAGPLVGGALEKFGAVLVTPRNYYRLLQSGQNVLLFPGGAPEALSGNKSYPLFWPEKVDFVRTAARFNATIVPLSAIGMVDSVNVLVEPADVYKLPFGIGERAHAQNSNITAARYDQKDGDEAFGVPLALPTIPSRNYFLFGKPIDTTKIDPRDKIACAMVYNESRSAVRTGLDDLLCAREHDPFKNTLQRFAYESVFGKKAPTFPVKDLHKSE